MLTESCDCGLCTMMKGPAMLPDMVLCALEMAQAVETNSEACGQRPGTVVKCSNRALSRHHDRLGNLHHALPLCAKLQAACNLCRLLCRNVLWR